MVGELCITPVGSQENQTCLQIELIIQDELQKIAQAIVECSSDLLAIDGNGGELPKSPLLGDAGCELRKNQYGTAILTLETEDQVNSLSWTFRVSDKNCETSIRDPQTIEWSGKNQSCQFAFQTETEVDNGSYKVTGADHILALSLKIPSLSSKRIRCQLQESAIWDCDITAKMNFKKRSNPWSWLIALVVSLLSAILMYLIWYSLIRKLSNFRKGSYRYTILKLGDIERIGEKQGFSSDKLSEFDFNSQETTWRHFTVRKGSREEKIGDIDVFARLAPPWKPHRVLDGGWGQIYRPGWIYSASPSASEPLSMVCDLNPTVLIGLDKNSNQEKPKGEACFIMPSSSRQEAIQSLKVQAVQELIRITAYFDDEEMHIAKSPRARALPRWLNFTSLLPIGRKWNFRRKTNDKEETSVVDDIEDEGSRWL